MKDKLENFTNHYYAEFGKVFLKVLYKHTPQKNKILRDNDNAFITWKLRNEIMLRSKFIKKEIISTVAIIGVSVTIT